MDVSRYGELFLTESREHLSQANQALLELESGPADTEAVNRIFRSMHTLKGMAGAMGYGAIERLTHSMENRLERARSGHDLTPDEIDLLFKSVDSLETLVGAAVDPDSAEDHSTLVDSLIERLNPVGKKPQARKSQPRRSRPAGRPKGVRLGIIIRSDAALKGARAAMAVSTIEKVSAVISVVPPLDEMGDEFDGRFVVTLPVDVDLPIVEEALAAVGEIEGVRNLEETAAQRSGTTRARHIRVDLDRLDALVNLIGEMASERGQLLSLAARIGDSDLEDSAQRISKLTDALRSEVLQSRLTPVWQVFDRFPRLVRDLSRKLGKKVDLEVRGKDTEMDRAVLDEIGDPLVHLLRNAIDHGVETEAERKKAGKPPVGKLVLAAERDRSGVLLRIEDDGKGIDRELLTRRAQDAGIIAPGAGVDGDEELLRILAAPGFSTASSVSEVSGRGVGIDAVMTVIENLGGAVELQNRPGDGTTWLLRIPTTLDIVRALMVGVGGQRYAIPIHQISETTSIEASITEAASGADRLQHGDDSIPLHDLRKLFKIEGERGAHAPVVVLEVGNRRAGVVVDRFVGQQEVVVKSFVAPKGTLPVFSGATLLSDGLPALILDAGGFVKERAEWMTQ